MELFEAGEQKQLGVEINKKQFMIYGQQMPEGNEVFRAALSYGHGLSLKEILDAWLWRDRGGKIGRMAWELRGFAASLAQGRDLAGATRLADIIHESINEACGEEAMASEEVALELAVLLATFLDMWYAQRCAVAALQ